MPEERHWIRLTDFDGLQVVEDAPRLQKYPAKLIDEPKYLTRTDDGGLHVISKENSLHRIHKNETGARPRTKVTRKWYYCVGLVFFCLAVAGACLGGVLGSRRHKLDSKPSTVT